MKSCKYVKQENYEGIFVEVNKVVSTLIVLFCVHFMRFEPASKLSIWGSREKSRIAACLRIGPPGAGQARCARPYLRACSQVTLSRKRVTTKC